MFNSIYIGNWSAGPLDLNIRPSLSPSPIPRGLGLDNSCKNPRVWVCLTSEVFSQYIHMYLVSITQDSQRGVALLKQSKSNFMKIIVCFFVGNFCVRFPMRLGFIPVYLFPYRFSRNTVLFLIYISKSFINMIFVKLSRVPSCLGLGHSIQIPPVLI